MCALNQEAYEHRSAHLKEKVIAPRDNHCNLALERAGLQTRCSYTSIRLHHNGLHANAQDVYNFRHLHRVEMLVVHSPPQALIDSIESTDVISHVRQTPGNI